MNSNQTTPFRFRAADPSGVIRSGVLDAVSIDSARAELTRQSLVPLDISPRRDPFRLPQRKPSRQDLAAVFRNVASLTKAGMPVEPALRASEPLVKGPLAEALEESRRRIRQGASVAEALRASPGVFPAVAIGTVAAGERGSRLAEALERVAEQLESESQLRAELRSALAYPILILFVGIVSIVVMGFFVIPRFAEVLTDLGAELPASTRLLLGLSTALRDYAVLLVFFAVATSALVAVLLRRPETREAIDRMVLSAPLVGGINHGFASARVCRALSAMLGTGMPLLSALHAAEEAAGNREVAERLRESRREIAEGSPLSATLERHAALVPVALQLVAVGEASGELSSMMGRAGDLAADRAERALRAATTMMEPALVIVLGCGVALIAGALLQAVYSVRPGM